MDFEAFKKQVAKLKRKVSGEQEFFCHYCGQALKSYQHGELMRVRQVEADEKAWQEIGAKLDEMARRQGL